MGNYDNKILIINLKLAEMKKLKTIKSIGILLLLVSGLFLASCSKKKESLAIPKDANSVGVIDVYSLVKKGKLHEIKDLEFFKAIEQEAKNENKKVYKIVDDFLENPAVTGLNFKEDVVFYNLGNVNDKKFTSLLVEVKNQGKFEKFIKDISDGFQMPLEIKKENGYSYIEIQNEAIISWDDNKAILLTQQGYRNGKNLSSQIERLMSLKEEDKIVRNDNFNEFYKNKKDISIWLSSNFIEQDDALAKMQKGVAPQVLEDILGDNYKSLKKQNKIASYLADNYFSLYVDFKENSVSTLYKITPNKEISKIMKDYDIWGNSFNSKLLNYFPKKSYLAASLSIDLEALQDIMEKEVDSKNSKFKTDFKKETGFEPEELYESFNGSAVFSFWDIDEVEHTYMGFGDNYHQKTEKNLIPKVGLAVDINNDKIIKKLVEEMMSNKDVKKQDNYYEFTIGKYEGYFAFDDKVFVVTNDKECIKAFEAGGYGADNLGNSYVSSGIKNSKVYTFLNLNYQDYPEPLKNQMQQIGGARLEKVLEVWDGFAKSIEMRQIDEKSFEVIFNTKEKEGNSLNTIISTISESYETLLSL